MTKTKCVSLKPSDATLQSKDYGSPSADTHISGRASVYGFSTLIKALSIHTGESYVAIQKELSKKVASRGWADESIAELREIQNKITEISLFRRDRLLDSYLKQPMKFSPEDIELSGMAVRIFNESVLDDLRSQASICGVDLYLYVPIRMIQIILEKNDWCRENGKRTLRLGASEEPFRKAVKYLEDWVSYRINTQRSAVEFSSKT